MHLSICNPGPVLPMKQRHYSFVLCTIISLCCLFSPTPSQALDCGNSDMSGSNNCLFYGSMGTVGGTLATSNNSLYAANMAPYQQVFGVGYWHDTAVQALTDGTTFRDDNLLLLDVPVDNTTPQGRMLLDPKLNYEDVGLISFADDDGDGLPDSFTLPDNIDQQLLSAIATFGYEACTGSDLDAEDNLHEALRLLANIYLMIGDEFLIDALEWRFSADTLGMDAKLDEQLLLLAKARLLHDASVAAFVQGIILTRQHLISFISQLIVCQLPCGKARPKNWPDRSRPAPKKRQKHKPGLSSGRATPQPILPQL